MDKLIRKADIDDISRIAEILVFVKRMKFYPIFKDDHFSFNILQVLKVAQEYGRPEILDKIYVYDDGIVKGLIHIEEDEVKELYVDYFFQDQGIGGKLLEFAKQNFNVSFLWALEKNDDAIRFYKAHGFELTSIRKPETDTSEFLVMMKIINSRQEP